MPHSANRGRFHNCRSPCLQEPLGCLTHGKEAKGSHRAGLRPPSSPTSQKLPHLDTTILGTKHPVHKPLGSTLPPHHTTTIQRGLVFINSKEFSSKQTMNYKTFQSIRISAAIECLLGIGETDISASLWNLTRNTMVRKLQPRELSA